MFASLKVVLSFLNKFVRQQACAGKGTHRAF